MISEKDAILACQAGKTEMYRTLVEKYKSRAYYTALMYTKNRDDALDLSQEAFYRAYRALNRFNPDKNFYTWFYKILRNVCLNFITRKRENVPISDGTNPGAVLSETDGQPDEIFERNERSAAIEKALNHLKEKDREIIILKEFDGMSYNEIAEVLAIPLGSVMSRLYYARKKLLKELEYLNE